jgi:hypothetical protein
MMEPSTVPLMADARFCFSEKPCVSAPKMGARPSGSMTTSSVTKELNTNSMGGDFTSQGGTRFRDDTPPAPQRTHPIQGRSDNLAFLRPVTFAHLFRERPYHQRYIHR